MTHNEDTFTSRRQHRADVNTSLDMLTQQVHVWPVVCWQGLWWFLTRCCRTADCTYVTWPARCSTVVSSVDRSNWKSSVSSSCIRQPRWVQRTRPYMEIPNIYFASATVCEYAISVYVCLSVCQSLCLSVCLSDRSITVVKSFQNLLCVLLVAVARSSSNDNVAFYVLPVLWMTSCHKWSSGAESKTLRYVWSSSSGGSTHKAEVCYSDCLLRTAVVNCLTGLYYVSYFSTYYNTGILAWIGYSPIQNAGCAPMYLM